MAEEHYYEIIPRKGRGQGDSYTPPASAILISDSQIHLGVGEENYIFREIPEEEIKHREDLKIELEKFFGERHLKLEK